MRFFANGDFCNYPDTRDELRSRILDDAINRAQGIPICFFETYFRAHGGRIHPIIGDLEEFAAEIEVKWNENNAAAGRGINLVAGLIRNRLPQLPLNMTPT